jgi:hypothetical protein
MAALQPPPLVVAEVVAVVGELGAVAARWRSDTERPLKRKSLRLLVLLCECAYK